MRSFSAKPLAALACALGLIGALAVPALATAPPPAAAWRVSSVAVPANFTPGGEGQYEVAVANVGGAFANGNPLTITDVLPAGLTVKTLDFRLRTNGTVVDFSGTFCKTETAGEIQTVRCTVPSELPGSTPARLGPSEIVRLLIGVAVPASASGSLINAAQVQGGGAPIASTSSQNEANPEPAPPGFQGFGAALTGPDGLPTTQAGSHPYQFTTDFAVNTRLSSGSEASFVPSGGDIKDIDVKLPPGLIGNPSAVAQCTAAQFNTFFGETLLDLVNGCPESSVIGLVTARQIEGGSSFRPIPLYNLAPPQGMPAQFGFQIERLPFYIDTSVRTGSDYGVTASLRNTTQIERVTAASVTVWGTPADPAHNPLRGDCLARLQTQTLSLGNCPAGVPPRPFLRLPTSCASPLLSEMSFNTWTNPAFVSAASSAPAPGGCATLDFSPTIAAQPQVKTADSPTGLHFNLHLPQNEDPEGTGEADLKDITVALPAGVTVNPASATGLDACTPAQVGLTSPVGQSPATFTPDPAHCPDAAKIGKVEIKTPLLDHPVEGSVYLATQTNNPFGSLIALYITAADPQTGVVVKLAGKVDANSQNGQLTARFENNPQVPFEDLTTDFFEGSRAALRTPTTCGTYTTTATMTPWSAPASGPDAVRSDSFAVTTAPNGGPCASSEAQLPNQPSFAAGTLAPLAATYSPFVMNLSRPDGSQNLRGLSLSLPRGLVGKLAGIPYCSEAALAQAGGRAQPGQGAAELASPSCPGASQVGTVTIGAGAGPSPFHTTGRVYLAGPYKGAPLSFAIITPAVAGPFDLGTVVVRAAVNIDPETAQVTVDSDPFPTILQGIPLDVRSISVAVDRSGFTLNPTNCQTMAVTGTALSVTGQSAPLSDRFQVGGCRGLDFKPQLAINLKGGTKRSDHPALRAVLGAKPGEANIRKAVVALPHSEFLDQAHIGTVCTRVQFAANNCPKASIYGKAKAITPLLGAPLQGPVYLRSSSNPLPDLVADLRGQIHVVLAGRIDSVNGGIRTTFATVPDAPVTKFTLEMQGGKKGLLVNSRNLCVRANHADVDFSGQNGKAVHLRPVVKASCKKKKQ